MRTLLVAACLLAILALPGASAADTDTSADTATWQCLGMDRGLGFTGTCWTDECGYLYVFGAYAGEYGPCVSG